MKKTVKKERKQISISIPSFHTLVSSLEKKQPMVLDPPLERKRIKRERKAGEEEYFNAVDWFDSYYLLFIASELD